IYDRQGQDVETEAVVDTGFTGSLSLPPPVISVLNPPFRRRGRAVLADGRDMVFDVFEAVVIWDGRPIRVPVAEADTDPLVGMSLMQRFELTVEAVDGGAVRIRALPS